MLEVVLTVLKFNNVKTVLKSSIELNVESYTDDSIFNSMEKFRLSDFGTGRSKSAIERKCR